MRLYQENVGLGLPDVVVQFGTDAINLYVRFAARVITPVDVLSEISEPNDTSDCVNIIVVPAVGFACCVVRDPLM